jgi:hypothetical protein
VIDLVHDGQGSEAHRQRLPDRAPRRPDASNHVLDRRAYRLPVGQVIRPIASPARSSHGRSGQARHRADSRSSDMWSLCTSIPGRPNRIARLLLISPAARSWVECLSLSPASFILRVEDDSTGEGVCSSVGRINHGAPGSTRAVGAALNDLTTSVRVCAVRPFLGGIIHVEAVLQLKTTTLRGSISAYRPKQGDVSNALPPSLNARQFGRSNADRISRNNRPGSEQGKPDPRLRNAPRVTNSLPAPAEATYIEVRRRLRRQGENFGLPAGYTSSDMG